MYRPFDIEVICEFLQDQENLEQVKPRKSQQSPIHIYALRLLEYYNSNASDCLSLAEAPPTPDRLNDFGILKVPDQLSEVIFLNIVCFDNSFICLHRFSHCFLYSK
jgi:hypothetical protein